MSNMEIQKLYEKYIDPLLPNEQLKLVEIIVNKLGDKIHQVTDSQQPITSLSDWEKSNKWLESHHQEYANQWVALLGDKLLAVGENAKEVYDSAIKQGVSVPFLARVENSVEEQHYFGGWQ